MIVNAIICRDLKLWMVTLCSKGCRSSSWEVNSSFWEILLTNSKGRTPVADLSIETGWWWTHDQDYLYHDHYRVAEVVRRHEGSSPKSLDLEENFKPEYTLFCRKLRFVAIYALFGDLLAKKVSFWVKNSVSWARSALLHGIYCIFHWVNFANLQLRAKTTHSMRI